MAKVSLSTQRNGAAQIKTEQTTGANTQVRVGGLLGNIIDSSVQEYDNTATYTQGQWVIFEGALAQALTSTNAGESPTTAKLKWSRKLVVDPAQIALGNQLPVSADAVKQAIDQKQVDGAEVPNATETQLGKTRFGTGEEVAEGVRGDLAVSILRLHNYFQDFFKDGILASPLQETLSAGGLADSNLATLAIRLLGVGIGYQLWNTSNGTNSQAASFELDSNGRPALFFGGKNVLSYDSANLILGNSVLQFPNADAVFAGLPKLLAIATQGVFQTYAHTVLQNAPSFDSVYVPVLNVINNQYELKAVPKAQAWQELYATANKAALAGDIAPFLQSQTVPGDDRVIEDVFCYQEIAQKNEEYISISQSDLGPNPNIGITFNHDLQTPGSLIDYRIWATDTDGNRQDASAYIVVSFPDATHYSLTLKDQTITNFSGKLYLRKQMFGDEISGGGIRYVLQFQRISAELAPNPALGQDANKALYLVPANASAPAIGSVFAPIARGLVRYPGYQGPLTHDCAGGTTPPPTGGPIVTAITLPSVSPGQDYNVKFTNSDFATPGTSGAVISYITATNKHPWLNVQIIDTNTTGVYGTAPADLTTTTVILGLTAWQSDGKITNGAATIPVQAQSQQTEMFLGYKAGGSGSDRTLIIRGGGDFGKSNTANNPFIKATYQGTWTGNSIGKIQMVVFEAALLGKLYTYHEPQYTGVIPGTYLIEYTEAKANPRVKYGQITITENDNAEHTIELYDTPQTPGTTPIAPVQIQYAWDPTSGTVNVYVLTNGGTGKLEAAFEATGPSGYSFNRTAYAEMIASNFGGGYTHNIYKANLQYSSSQGLNLTVYLRRQGSTTDLAVPLYIPGSQIIPRGQIYPPPTVSAEGVYASYSGGTATATITKVGYTFQRSSNGANSTSEVYFTSDGTIEVGFSTTDNPTPAGFSLANAGTYSNGYNRYTSIYGVYSGQTLTLHFRQQGTTSIIRSITLPVFPNTSVALTQVYP